jgi:hypothetical protein
MAKIATRALSKKNMAQIATRALSKENKSQINLIEINAFANKVVYNSLIHFRF